MTRRPVTFRCVMYHVEGDGASEKMDEQPPIEDPILETVACLLADWCDDRQIEQHHIAFRLDLVFGLALVEGGKK